MISLGPALVILLLVALNGFFVAAEFAIIGVRPSRIQQLAREGNRTARWVEAVLASTAKMDRYIATSQLGITLASLGLGMYGEPFIAHLLEGPLERLGMEEAGIHTIAFFVALGTITYLHVVLGEMVPKSLALHDAEKTVLALAAPMTVVERIFAAPVWLLNHIGVLALRLLGVKPPGADSRVHTPDELEMIVSESFAGGLVREHEQELVANIFDFAERRVEQIMKPRNLVAAIPVSTNEQTVLELFASAPYSRLPVYEGSIDDVIGYVHLKDIVRQQLSGRPFNLRELILEVPFVPETLLIEDLLEVFRENHVQIAIALDEHGGTAGLVSFEDLIEEVLGEVVDEFDQEEPPLVQLGPGHVSVEGTYLIEDLAEHIHVNLQNDEVNTVGGLILSELGRVPAMGDTVIVNDVEMKISAVQGLTITRVEVRYSPVSQAHNEE